MVNLSTVRTSNAELRARAHGLVGVFVGATGGIGASTLRELTIRLSAPRFYVIGRSETKFVAQRDELLALNPSAIITFLQAEVSLLRDVDAVCKTIAAKEEYVDLLFMSAGFLAFGGPDCKPFCCFFLSGDVCCACPDRGRYPGQIRPKALTNAQHCHTTAA